MKIATPRDDLVLDDKKPSRTMAVWLSQASQMLTALGSSGTTADRPTAFIFVGRTYFDIDLGIPVFYDGTNWINSAGTTV